MTAGTLTVRVAQPDGPPSSHEAALAMVAGFLSTCDGVDLLVLPELALCGYGDGDRIRDLAVEENSAFLTALHSLVESSGTGLIAGLAMRQGETLYNCAIAIAPGQGTKAIYRKVHLWGDHEGGLFRPGTPSPVFEWNGLHLGLLICHDLDYPETAADLVARGADVIVVLSATNQHYGIIAECLVPARAYENVSYVVYCDACGPDGPFAFLGHSRLVAPNGNVLSKVEDQRPATADAVLSLATVREWRQRHPYR